MLSLAHHGGCLHAALAWSMGFPLPAEGRLSFPKPQASALDSETQSTLVAHFSPFAELPSKHSGGLGPLPGLLIG